MTLDFRFTDDPQAPRLEIADLPPMYFDGQKRRIRNYMATQHRDGRMHEPDFAHALIRLIRLTNPSVVFDIGAFIGYFTIMAAAASRRDTRIFAFEMNDASYQLLAANIVMNKHLAPSRIVPICAGVGAQTALARKVTIRGFAMFEGWDDEIDLSHIRNKDFSNSLRSYVDTLSLDHFCEQTSTIPDLVKIDIEGWECRCLEGASKLIASHSPTLLIELHADLKLAEFGYTQKSFLERIVDHGYELLLIADHKQRGESQSSYLRLGEKEMSEYQETRNTAVIAVSRKREEILKELLTW
jgi:FkbM family methyltransferase